MSRDQKTGIDYYVERLIASLEQYYPNRLELTGYRFGFWRRKFVGLCRRFGFQPLLELFVWRKADVVLSTDFIALPSLRRSKRVLFVYDLAFLDHPEFVRKRNLIALKRFCPPSIREADAIVTISDFTKARLEHHFPDLRASVVVTPVPPAETESKPADLGANLSAKGVKAGAYILYVGTIEPRKNLENLVNAYGQLDEGTRAKYALVLAGGKGWEDEKILRAIAAARQKGLNIILPGYVSEAEKAALYASAACFVLPSHYEGFGMPILEAMRYGVPVAASDIPVFHEVAGDAAVYFDQNKPGAIADGLSSVLNNPDLASNLAREAEVRLKAFSWQKNAQKVYETLR